MATNTILVNTYTNGILGPSAQMLGPVRDGGTIIANTAPGCWGPMITPEIRGGHEVTQPVAVEGAMPGDSIAIRILSIDVTSKVTSSGVDVIQGSFCVGDPFVAAKCQNCGKLWPKTHIEGIGKDAIKCDECGATVAPFVFANGYTIAFDEKKTVALTLAKEQVDQIAPEAEKYASLPEHSVQNPVTTLAPSDLPGIATRMRPFVGQLGTCPPVDTPDSHNAGDFGQFLIGAPHDYGIQPEGIEQLTDGHMDVNRVRAGAVLIVPVRMAGAGVYVGDMHAMQGDGEIAGHTADVSGVIVMQVNVMKGLSIPGPILLPNEEDLPHLAKPLNASEKLAATRLSEQWNTAIEETAPISFIGTGANLNAAVDGAISRASQVLGISQEEVKNRLTIAGGLEIGRYPGTVTATFAAPVKALKNAGLYDLVKEQYQL